MMEPILLATRPPEGYLEGVRELATRENVVLIFDEVTTNFRYGANGIQDFVGVVPDLACFAKAISNGYAMGAVVGKRWVMEPAADMFVSSTYWSDLVGIVAAITTLTEIERRDVPAQLADYGERLQSGMQEVLEEVDLPVEISGMPATPGITFAEPFDADESKKLNALVAQETAKRGVLFNTHPRHSSAHDDRDLGLTLEAFREALLVTKDAIGRNAVDDVLEASLAPAIIPRPTVKAKRFGMTTAEWPSLPECIQTPRLLLRRYRLTDAEDAFAYARDPEWGRFLPPVPRRYERRHADEFVAGQVLADWGQEPAWAMEHEGRVVGGVSLRLARRNARAELGYSVARWLWGRGLTTEAVSAVIDQAFQRPPASARSPPARSPQTSVRFESCRRSACSARDSCGNTGLLHGQAYLTRCTTASCAKSGSSARAPHPASEALSG